MSFRSINRILLLSLVCLFLGCAANRPYQTNKTQPILPELNGKPGLPAAVVEFDDAGELWDRCYLDSSVPHCELRDAINYIISERLKAAANNEDAIVVTFIHGWHHDAATNDENFTAFSTLLRTLQDNSASAYDSCHKAEGCPKHKAHFIGIYIGWRGEVTSIPPFNYLSLYNREKAAMRTGSVSMTETLILLRNAAKRTRSDDQSLPDESARFLLFGHSFGGLVLERAAAQMLATTVLPEHIQGGTPCSYVPKGITPFADLVLLINPAMDSIQTVELIDMLKRSKVKVCSPLRFSSGLTAPLIVAIHARNDAATGKGFALAHAIESFGRTFRDSIPDDIPDKRSCFFCGVGQPPKEGFEFRHTPGHAIFLANLCYIKYKNVDTEDLWCNKIRDHICAASTTQECRHQGQLNERAPGQIAAESVSSGDAVAQALSSPVGDLYYRELPAGESDYKGASKPWNDTPYWIFTVPKEVVDKHSGFWNADFTDMVTVLVRATTPPEGTAIEAK